MEEQKPNDFLNEMRSEKLIAGNTKIKLIIPTYEQKENLAVNMKVLVEGTKGKNDK